MSTDAVVYLVDDDPAVLRSLHWLVESASLVAKPLTSAASFLDAYDEDRPGCLVLDVRMPAMTGLQLQMSLKERGVELPVIIMTGHSDVPTCTESFRNGAFDFIEKPADDEFLIGRIQDAIATDVERRQQEKHRADIKKRLATLTPREREVMEAIVSGKSREAHRLGAGHQLSDGRQASGQGPGQAAGRQRRRGRTDAVDQRCRDQHRHAVLAGSRRRPAGRTVQWTAVPCEISRSRNRRAGVPCRQARDEPLMAGFVFAPVLVSIFLRPEVRIVVPANRCPKDRGRTSEREYSQRSPTKSQTVDTDKGDSRAAVDSNSRHGASSPSAAGHYSDSLAPPPLWAVIVGLAMFLAVGGAAIAVYAHTAPQASDRDPFIYAQIGKEIVAGKRLYSEAWIDKPPVGMLMYAAPQLIEPALLSRDRGLLCNDDCRPSVSPGVRLSACACRGCGVLAVCHFLSARNRDVHVAVDRALCQLVRDRLPGDCAGRYTREEFFDGSMRGRRSFGDCGICTFARIRCCAACCRCWP